MTFFNDKNLDFYFLDFLTISQLNSYLMLSKSSYNIVKQSAYGELMTYNKKYNVVNINNICAGQYFTLFKLYIRETYIVDYENILLCAIKSGWLKVINFLYHKNRILDNNKIKYVFKSFHLSSIKYFLLFYNYKEIDTLIYKIFKNYDNLEILKYLIYINHDNNINLIYYASQYGHLDSIKYLVERFNYLPIGYIIVDACRFGYLSILKYILFLNDNKLNICIAYKISAKYDFDYNMQYLLTIANL